MVFNNSLLLQWVYYDCKNKEQRTHATYPIVFNKVYIRLRTNINGSAAGGNTTAYSFQQVSPNTSTGDLPTNSAVYFYETANNRQSHIQIVAIGTI